LNKHIYTRICLMIEGCKYVDIFLAKALLSKCYAKVKFEKYELEKVNQMHFVLI